MDTIFGGLLFLAALNERALEYTLGRLHNARLDALLPVLSLALGVGEALAFGLNGVPTEWMTPWAGQVATGVALGMGSNGVHWLMEQVIKEH